MRFLSSSAAPAALVGFGLILCTSVASADAPIPNCNYKYRLTNRAADPTDTETNIAVSAGSATAPTIDNISLGCTGWILTTSSEGFSVVSIALQSAQRSFVSSTGREQPTAFSTFSGTDVSGSLPITSTTSSSYIGYGYFPYLRLSATLSGTGSVEVSLKGWQSITYAKGIGGSGGGSGIASINGDTTSAQVIAGTANQITVTSAGGTTTLSIPTNPTLPGNTTGTFIGNITGNASGSSGTVTDISSHASTELSDTAIIQKYTSPVTKTYTAGVGGVTANRLVKLDTDGTVIAVTGTEGIWGIAQSTASAAASVNVALLGAASCVAEGVITAGHYLIAGTTDPTMCKDSGVTTIGSLASTSRPIAKANAAASNGATFSVNLIGPFRFGSLLDLSNTTGILPAASGGTGVANSNTITLAGNLTTSGVNPLTLTTTGSTNVTLPTTGTLSTLAGSEALTGKTYNGLTVTSTTGTFTLTNGKTFSVLKTISLDGTDSTTMTFPSTSATIARTDAANTFTGTQTIGALVATTFNGNTFTTGTGVLTIAAGKTATINNTLTLAGTDATTMTFPTTSATIARTDAANTFTGTQTFSGAISGSSSVTGTTIIAPTVRTTAIDQLLTVQSQNMSAANKFAVAIGTGTWSQTSGANGALQITPTYNQASGSAANTDLQVNRTETAVGSGAQLLADFQVGGTSKAKIDNAGLITSVGHTITGSGVTLSGLGTASGSPDSVCLNTNTVVRNAALTCTVSSENVKNSFAKIPAGMDELLKIRPIQFKYNSNLQRIRWGFGAQQVASVNPALADGWRSDGQPWSLDQNAILALAVKSIQELNERVKFLEMQVRGLQAGVSYRNEIN